MKRVRDTNLYDNEFTLPLIRGGEDLPISTLKGKVVLVVNTASM